ncbi:MAG: hypothetical protein AAGK98_03775 [Pseudomonadota bacterium]
MVDEIAEMLGGFIALALLLLVVIAVAFTVGLVVIPAGLAGAGVLYYIHNIHLPEKRRRESLTRTEALYAEAQKLSPEWEHLRSTLFRAGINRVDLHRIARVLYDQEGLRPPVLPPVGNDQIKLARYQDTLERFINAAQPDHYRRFEEHLVSVLAEYQVDLDEDAMFWSERARTRAEIDRLIRRFLNDDGLFEPLIAQLNANFFNEGEVMPSASKHDDYAWRYLKDTPLLALADVEEPVSLSDRMYHTYLLGSSGSGKTVLLENIIAHDLRSDEDCCVVVIDSQTQLTEKLACLDVPDTTYITPKFDLSLNLFDVGYDDMKARGIEGETLINKTVGLLSFVLEGMMGAEFTNPQRTIFQYAIQLVIRIKGGNIFTFMDVLAEGGHETFAAEIAQLDDNLQRFFTVDFPSPEYKRTREAIRRKLDGLLLNPTFRRLFSATENAFDMFEELAERKLILIDTNKPMLDDAASAFFGRLFIAMILRASHMRFEKGRSMRPVYLIVDEAHEYFDRSVSDMLEQARKANIGLIVAHQSLSQSRGGGKGGSNIADPLMVNTATKIIWTAFREDAARFAGSMQVKPEEILGLPQFTFGMHTRKRGFTPIRGEADPFEGFPLRDDKDALQAAMEAAYGPSTPPPAEDDAGCVGEEFEARGEDAETESRKTEGDESKKTPPDVEMI